MIGPNHCGICPKIAFAALLVRVVLIGIFFIVLFWKENLSVLFLQLNKGADIICESPLHDFECQVFFAQQKRIQIYTMGPEVWHRFLLLLS